MADKSQQTEKPTPRRLEKARKEGQFPASKEFVAGVQFLVFDFLLSTYGRSWLGNLAQTSRMVLDRGFHVELTPAMVGELLYQMTMRLAFPMLVAGGVLVIAGLAAHLIVTRLGFSLKKLSPDFSRLNPAKNLKNLK